MARVKGLGRGLDALLGGPEPAAEGALKALAVTALRPGRYQPRTRMDSASLQELAESIRAQGVIQPILVRPIAEDAYEIIAGERRWRASQLAGLDQVPVLVREVPDNAALALALIENIQREDLNPLEQASGIQRLIDEFGMTHQQAAEAVGYSRSGVTNLLRLLNLAHPVQELLAEGKLDMGHARALLAVAPAQQIQLARQVVAKGLSVRETERLVARAAAPPKAGAAKKRDRDVLRLQEQLADQLGTAVEVRTKKGGGGHLVIGYTSADHLAALLQRMKLRT